MSNSESKSSKPSIKLYQFEHCPYCRKVRQKLREKGLEYEKIEVDRNNKPDVVLETGGTVPVIDIDGMVMSESDDIVKYLDENL
ncbi:MAG: glutathione S-transferase N-terminal domain-containing protein [Candidatus Woesearchaeota archaeon]